MAKVIRVWTYDEVLLKEHYCADETELAEIRNELYEIPNFLDSYYIEEDDPEPVNLVVDCLEEEHSPVVTIASFLDESLIPSGGIKSIFEKWLDEHGISYISVEHASDGSYVSVGTDSEELPPHYQFRCKLSYAFDDHGCDFIARTLLSLP